MFCFLRVHNKLILSFTGIERRNQRYAWVTDPHICSSMTGDLNLELAKYLKIMLLVINVYEFQVMASGVIFHTCNITLHESCYQTSLIQKYTLFPIFLSIATCIYFRNGSHFENWHCNSQTVNLLAPEFGF
jgi:hypothetical protein